jgi:hypothetical protein
MLFTVDPLSYSYTYVYHIIPCMLGLCSLLDLKHTLIVLRYRDGKQHRKQVTCSGAHINAMRAPLTSMLDIRRAGY